MGCSSGVRTEFEKSDKCKERYQSTRTGVSNNFENQNLSNAKFRNMNLSYACYINANLENVSFNYSDLSSARFEKANVKSASFKCSNLTNADLRFVKNLTQEQLNLAYGEYARLPEGFSLSSNKASVGCDQSYLKN